MDNIRLQTSPTTDFNDAKAQATEAAHCSLAAPMLLSWLDRETGQHSPPVDCCGDGEKETWEIYAESRGANLRVEVADRFVFMFGEGLQ